MATIVAKVGQNANAMGKRVNKERVERETDTPALNLQQFKLATVGSYLKAKNNMNASETCLIENHLITKL